MGHHSQSGFGASNTDAHAVPPVAKTRSSTTTTTAGVQTRRLTLLTRVVIWVGMTPPEICLGRTTSALNW